MARTVEHVQSLLRGELSAIETYDQALEKIETGEGAVDLRRIRDEHRRAANALEQYARLEGDEPAKDSGAWGSFAKLVQGTANLMGDSAALRALREGEEHGVKEYEGAISSGHLIPAVSDRIRGELLPTAREHLVTLDRLIERA